MFLVFSMKSLIHHSPGIYLGAQSGLGIAGPIELKKLGC